MTDQATMVRLLRTEWRLKLLLTVSLNLWVCVPYYVLQQWQFFPQTLMPPSRIDEWIGFHPSAVWIYLSLYLLMPIAPLLMVERRDLLRYAAGMMGTSAIATFIFIFWPTSCPRPVAADPVVAYQLLIAIDRPLHALPSLHASFAVFSALCGQVAFKKFREARRLQLVLWLWVGFIFYAALATKQHVWIDLVAGGLLGLLAFLFAFKWNFRVSSRALPLAKTSTQETS